MVPAIGLVDPSHMMPIEILDSDAVLALLMHHGTVKSHGEYCSEAPCHSKRRVGIQVWMLRFI